MNREELERRRRRVALLGSKGWSASDDAWRDLAQRLQKLLASQNKRLQERVCNSMPNDQLLLMAKNILNFPFPQVCRHLIACDFLSILETRGVPRTDLFAQAEAQIVAADDAGAICALEKLLAQGIHFSTPVSYQEHGCRPDAEDEPSSVPPSHQGCEEVRR